MLGPFLCWGLVLESSSLRRALHTSVSSSFSEWSCPRAGQRLGCLCGVWCFLWWWGPQTAIVQTSSAAQHVAPWSRVLEEVHVPWCGEMSLDGRRQKQWSPRLWCRQHSTVEEPRVRPRPSCAPGPALRLPAFPCAFLSRWAGSSMGCRLQRLRGGRDLCSALCPPPPCAGPLVNSFLPHVCFCQAEPLRSHTVLRKRRSGSKGSRASAESLTCRSEDPGPALP